MSRLAIGLDFGTLSARAIVVDVDTGESTSFTSEFEHGIIEDPARPDVARQDPDNYLAACEQVLRQAAGVPGESIGIGVGATASTPIPVDSDMSPVSRKFKGNYDSYSWLWKDHSSQEEADEITRYFSQVDPHRLARVGAYYAEWYWAKILQCARRSPDIFESAKTWLEQGDFVAANLTGSVTRGVCAAGHKALYVDGFPSAEVLLAIHPGLARVAESLPEKALPTNQIAGGLSPEWAERTGLPQGLPVAVAGVDAHLGAVGAGVKPGTVCLVLGTSACHIAIAPYDAKIRSVPGISGIADDSVLPGMLGLEAGQAAFGDLFEWAAELLASPIDELSQKAAHVPPGSNGLIVVDFHAGNRCPYADARLSGAMIGQTLATTPAETFRACLEACAMGIRQILELLKSAGVPVSKLVACGGVTQKSELLLQIIADVTGMEVTRSASDESSALGAAIFGSVVGSAFKTADDAQDVMCRGDLVVKPTEAHNAYNCLFPIWKRAQQMLAKDTSLVKDLLDFRDSTP